MYLMDIGHMILTIIPTEFLLGDYLYLVMGIGIIISGLLIRAGKLDRFVRRRARKMQTQVELAKWGMYFTPDEAGLTLVTEIAVLTTRFQALSMTLFGVFLVVITAGLAIIDYVFFAGLLSKGFLIIGYVPFIVLAMQAIGPGYLIAARHLRRKNTDQHIAAELRQRSLTDFRARFFPFVTMFIWLASILNVFIALNAYQQHTLHLIPNEPLSLTIIVALIILFMAVSGIVIFQNELIMRAVVYSPRIVAFSYPPLAIKIDTMVRARTISMLQMVSIGFSAGLLGGQAGILMNTLSRQSNPLWIGVNVEYLLSALFVAAGFLTMGALGHIGGTITGWPWQQKIIEQAE